MTPTTDHLPKNNRPSTKRTIDHQAEKPPTTDHRPPTNGCEKTDHQPEQQPTTDQITVVKPPTTDQITVVKPPTTDHTANMLYLLRDFSAIAILWYRVPHMNGADLNLPGKSLVIKIDRRTSILNNDGMVACGFLGIKCARLT